ncbi:MAG: glycosyltransferase [Burkholderiales bacterium]|nr:glycosyltransferase [Burkholderiales bacterium]
MSEALEAGALRVAYLVNHYPKVSHSFIRREILALERQGIAVTRIAVRGWADALPDPADRAERERTRYLLQSGIAAPLGSALVMALTRPLRFLRAARLAASMWRRSERTVFHHLAYLAEACRVVQWTDAARCTHLHAHFGTNGAEVAMLARELGGPPYSFTVHGPEEFDSPQALGLGEKARRSAFVVAVSSFGRSQLLRWLPAAHWPKVEVVHCGLEQAFHRGAPAGASAAPRLVCVGRLCEQKGQLLLVEATKRVVDAGHPVELVLAGDGEMRAEVEALIDQLGLRANVRITGWIANDQVREEILAARALVLPSFAEGLPVVIMEAMALRRPVITTFVAGIPELVRDGESGWLIAAGDVDGLAGAMAACLAAPTETLERMGEAAHARVLARHDVDIEAAKLAKLFRASSAASPSAPMKEAA